MENEKQVFIVGDVHGCYMEFLELLKKVNYQKATHRLILVGDIINRGPHSLKMLEWVQKEEAEVVRGNHEDHLLKLIQENRTGTSSIQKIKEEMGSNAKEWAEWIKSWPYYIEEKDFIVVHGGLLPHQKIEDTDPRWLMNIRTWGGEGVSLKKELHKPWHEFYNDQKLVVYGHWAQQGLKVKPNSIGLDTGCVYGKQLSGVLLPQREIIQVNAHKDYWAISN